MRCAGRAGVGVRRGEIAGLVVMFATLASIAFGGVDLAAWLCAAGVGGVLQAVRS